MRLNSIISSVFGSFLILASLAMFNLAQAVIVSPDDVPVKDTGDAISAGEFNTVLNALRGWIKDDNGTESLADDKVGLFLPSGISPTQELDVNGGVRGTFLYGDGSNITNLPETYWLGSGNDINYPTGRVGIGNANPSSALDVVGDIEFSGTIKTAAGEVRCLVGEVMVGFNASGILCETAPQLYQ